MDKEIRTIQTAVETREAESGGNVIEGYALKFNTRSQVLGVFTTFVETLDRNCLNGADMRSTVATFNHDQSQIIGRVDANMTLNIDDVGLRFAITMPDTTIAHDVLENIRAGILNKCSFTFSINGYIIFIFTITSFPKFNTFSHSSSSHSLSPSVISERS